MPESGLSWLNKDETLTTAEIKKLVSVFVQLGVRTVRLTGGEPLLHPDLVEIVSTMSALRTPLGEPVDVAMTTNGIGLERVINNLVAAGLTRLNISLDTLNPNTFRELSRRDRLDDVLTGISSAQASGLEPLKLNAVALRGVNEHELADLVRYALSVGAEMRFIEQMPLDISHLWSRENLLSRDEILTILRKDFTLQPAGHRESSPAERWIIDGGPATVGVIASVTAPFCGACDRMRLTADGQLRNCLFAREEGDLRSLLRAGSSQAEIAEAISRHIFVKRAGHGIGEPDFVQPSRGMNAIGG